MTDPRRGDLMIAGDATTPDPRPPSPVARTAPRRGFVAVVASATLALAGCGPSGEPAPPEPAQPTNEAVTWANSICGSLVPAVEALTSPPPVDLDNAAATRQAYIEYLEDAHQRAEQALQALDAAGPAPVPGGEELARNVRDQLADLRDDLADALARVEAAEPGDVAAVGEAVVAAANVLGSLANAAHAAAVISGDPQLRPAFVQAQSCERLRTITDPP
jgi:hypothetical protein